MINEEIQKILKSIEKHNNLKILYACESGSRIYGFANEYSDYDIRFIFLKDKDSYLLNNFKDTYEDMIDKDGNVFDIVGWDFRKMLHLHKKGNPNLREWIDSPIKYIPDTLGIFEDLPHFQKKKLFHHYYSISKQLYKKYKTDNNLLMNRKKYLYILRGIYSCKFIIMDKNNYPPISLYDLFESVELKSKDTEILSPLLNSLNQFNPMSIEELYRLNLYIESNLKQLECEDILSQYSYRDEEYVDNIYEQKFLNILNHPKTRKNWVRRIKDNVRRYC